jgi:hypothetical protein
MAHAMRRDAHGQEGYFKRRVKVEDLQVLRGCAQLKRG